MIKGQGWLGRWEQMWEAAAGGDRQSWELVWGLLHDKQGLWGQMGLDSGPCWAP